MDAKKGPEIDDDAYLASFESSNRKQKIIVIAAAIIVALVAAGAFYATIGSMGKMSENVHGAFDDGTAKPEGEAAPQETLPPATQDAAPAVIPPAESPEAIPETQGQTAPETAPTPAP